MSQAGKVITNTVGPGDTTGLKGNDNLVVVPDGSGHINVIGDGVTLSTSRTGANTLFIEIEGTDTNSLTTNDNAYHTILTITPAVGGAAITGTGYVIGSRVDAGIGVQYSLACGGQFSFVSHLVNGSGTATLINQTGTPDRSAAATNASYQVIVSGINTLVQVRGETGQVWDWKAVINFVEI